MGKALSTLGQEAQPLALLSSHGDGRPIFMVPGGDDDTSSLLPIARHLSCNGPVYGLRPRGRVGVSPPQNCVEDMAEYLIAAIMEVQAHGPYVLVGHSLGGLVVLEAACRLLERGEQISSLVLLDTYPHHSQWPWRLWIVSLAGRVKHHASQLTRLPLKQTLPYAAAKLETMWRHIRARSGGEAAFLGAAEVEGERNGKPRRLHQASKLAWSYYRVRDYPGKMTFVQAVPRKWGDSLYPTDLIELWKRRVRHLDIHRVWSDHGAIVTLDAKSIAHVISSCIRA